MRGAYAGKRPAQSGQAGAALSYAHLLAQPEFEFGAGEQDARFAAPLRNAPANRLALFGSARA
jgi:hypothetical protein